jgi:histidinol-phosphatase
MNITELVEFAKDAVWQAGQLTLGYFQTGVTVERKADNTPLTIADQRAEQLLRRLIGEQFPDHAIIGEEYGRSPNKDAQYTWIIDPIDGTKSFICGVPLYSNLLALMDGETALLGIINLPALGEMIVAVRGEGCYLNGRRVQVSQTEKLSDAVVLTSGLHYFGSKQPVWDRLVYKSAFQRTWGDAYGYVLVATGRADVMLDAGLAVWDAGPLQVIIEEAGGMFTDWQGTPTIHNYEGIATNGRLHPTVLAEIKAAMPNK